MNVMGIAALITVFMAVLALYLAPMGLKKVNRSAWLKMS